MLSAKLIINEFGQEPLEIEIKSGLITLGRAVDNTVALVSDSNVSRYHAEIERRGDNFHLIDLNSRNGTFVNDQQIEGERRLQNGDKVSLGGDNSTVELKIEDSAAAQPPQPEEPESGFGAPHLPTGGGGFSLPQTATAASAPPAPTSNMPVMLTAAAVLSGLAIIAVVGVVLFLAVDWGCEGEATISSPGDGDTISAVTSILVSAKNPKCINRVSFRLDGNEFASADVAPYKANLEPEKLSDLVDDGATHILSVAVIDKNGKAKIQKGEVRIAFAKSETDEPEAKETPDDPIGSTDEPEPPTVKTTQITLSDTKQMCEQLLKLYSPNLAYRFDPQFLKQVQARTAEYKAEGFFNRAAVARDAINVTFFNEKGLYAPLGYHLAMSRSRFENKRVAGKEGLWQMTHDFAAANGYNGQCGIETLSDATQNCAARVAAAYTKALVDLFEGDLVYSVACFELSPADAGNFKMTLSSADRADFWNAIKSGKQREQIVRFFAAGIVAENPQKFGLKRDKALFNLYQNLLSR